MINDEVGINLSSDIYESKGVTVETKRLLFKVKYIISVIIACISGILILTQVIQRIFKIMLTLQIYRLICLTTYLTGLMICISIKFKIDYNQNLNVNIHSPSISYFLTFFHMIIAVSIIINSEFVGYIPYSMMNIMALIYSYYFCASMKLIFIKLEIVTSASFFVLSPIAYVIEYYYKILFCYQVNFEKSYESIKSTFDNMHSGIIQISKDKIINFNTFMKSHLGFLICSINVSNNNELITDESYLKNHNLFLINSLL